MLSTEPEQSLNVKVSPQGFEDVLCCRTVGCSATTVDSRVEFQVQGMNYDFTHVSY